jgi:hypothetical protein
MRTKYWTPLTALAVLLVLQVRLLAKDTDLHEADIIIYGGTSAGIIAAVQATKMDKSVIVVGPDVHLGGLTSGGLGATDSGKKAAIGGLARDFYHRVWKHYSDDEAWNWTSREKFKQMGRGYGDPEVDGDKPTLWRFEPHVAEGIFENYVEENDFEVYRDEWLDREAGVKLKKGKIVSITMLSGKRFAGKVFIDATYEGDLMAAAGVSYHVGREAMSTYGEKYNGVQTGVLHHRHFFTDRIDPYVVPGDPSSGVLPEISTEDPGVYGEADHRIQAYNFRMCLTNVVENRIPFPKPEVYNPERYELLLRQYASGWREHLWMFSEMPNSKTDTNNHGPFSTDYIGGNYAYPEADYKTRKKIILDHENYQKGLMYFITNDPRVPQDVQEDVSEWGLAGDEFLDNGHWPHQLYVREARRMIGEYVMSESDITHGGRIKDSIGMGSYTLDSHNTQRYITCEGYVQNEGDIGVRVPAPYRISYRSITPKEEECENLLVPVCVSSSHMAFGSIRMEPVFMILGQSAAAAASLAIDDSTPVQSVSYDALREVLLAEGQFLEMH